MLGVKVFLLALFWSNFFLWTGMSRCGAASSAQAEKYTVQLLSTIDQKYARHFIKQLKLQGIDAYLKTVSDADGKKNYRVRTGRFATPAAAKSFVESTVRSRGIMGRVVAADTEPQTVLEKASPVPVPDTPKTDPEDCSGRISRIFKYLDQKGTLQVTNSPETLSEANPRQIVEVSVFPVCFSSFNLGKMVFRVETADRIYRVRLKDAEAVLKGVSRKDINAFWDRLKQAPLRLKYRPVAGEFDLPVDGTIYFRSGQSIGLEMVRQGLARPNLKGLPEFMRGAYRAAQQEAKKRRAGTWSETRP